MFQFSPSTRRQNLITAGFNLFDHSSRVSYLGSQVDVSSSSCFSGIKLSPENKSSFGVYKISRVSCRASKVAAGESTLNLEQVLSVDHSINSSSLNDKKRAYRIMALRYHPDVCDRSRRKESNPHIHRTPQCLQTPCRTSKHRE